MTNPLISIIIPSFNKVKFIGETLESVIAQNYPNFEVIIEDGGSTDGTLEIITVRRRVPGNNPL
jgi:glycosyltransferase involved in cell wall biosynthesis